MVILKIKTAGLSESSELSLAEHAHELLVSKVVSLELPPGMPLLERDLMGSLDLGRTPIREGLHRLANEGLVCRLPHHGVYVCDITSETVRQLYELRLMMDGTVCRLVTDRASDEQVAQIIATAKALELSYQEEDLASFTAIGRSLSQIMAAASGNIHVTELMPRMYNLDARLTYLANQELNSWQVLGHGIVETALSLAGVIHRRLPGEAKLLAELHIERRYQYLFEITSRIEARRQKKLA